METVLKELNEDEIQKIYKHYLSQFVNDYVEYLMYIKNDIPYLVNENQITKMKDFIM